MSDHAKPPPDRTPFERFSEAMKRIMAMPKTEVERRAKQQRKRRKRKHT
jgi:hypothetical protein